MSTSTIAKHYTRLLSLWPKDPLRREPFTNLIEHRGAPYGVQPLTPADPKNAPKTANATAAPSPPPAPSNPSAELPQINALYSLVSNRYATRYPTSPALLNPASNPEHYERLMAEIERAPNKSWVQAKWDEWKMKIRWT